MSKCRTLFFAVLDDRSNIYDENATAINMKCSALLRDFTINVNGDVSLCCLDWNNKYIFGNVEKEMIRDIISKEPFRRAVNELINGIRNRDICKGCSGKW